MTHLVLRERLHLAKGYLMTHWHEHRIVTETPVAARRPHQYPIDPAVERFDLSVIWPGDRERACEMRGWGGIGLGCFDFAPDLRHRALPVAVSDLVFGPARRENARAAVQRVDAEAAIVGKRRKAAQVSGHARLQIGVVGEGIADLLGFGEVEFRRTDACDPERRDQLGDLAQFARIAGLDDQFSADRPHALLSFWPVAFSWAVKISPQPIRARRNSRSNPSSSNVSPSAVNCASTIAPSAASTKLP